MKKYFFLFSLVLFFGVQNFSFAQQQVTLTETELEEFRERAATKILDFTDYLPVIANKQKPQKTRLYYVEQALELFIAKGKNSTMEVASILKNDQYEVKTFKMPEYLNSVMNLNYKQVKIEFAETFYVSNFYKVEKNKYTATATIFQKFTGYGADGAPKYEDITKKTIEIVVELVEDMHGTRWVVLLNNISVAEVFKP